jgi:hypothetical protein
LLVVNVLHVSNGAIIHSSLLYDQAAVPSERGSGNPDGFFFDRIPKKKRMMLKRRMSNS